MGLCETNDSVFLYGLEHDPGHSKITHKVMYVMVPFDIMCVLSFHTKSSLMITTEKEKKATQPRKFCS